MCQVIKYSFGGEFVPNRAAYDCLELLIPHPEAWSPLRRPTLCAHNALCVGQQVPIRAPQQPTNYLQ